MQFHFDEFELDVERRLLLRRGVPCEMRPLAFNGLVHLIRHRDRVVSRDEVTATLWPDVQVSGASFYQIVRQIRRALGDDGRTQKLIRTSRGSGLQFVGAVRVAGAPAAVEESGDAYVGRPGVLARLEAGLESAISGNGGVVLLTGGPGLGKTRTARELATTASLRGARTLWGRGLRDESSVFWPFSQIIRAWHRGAPPDPERDAETLAAVREIVGEAGSVPAGGSLGIEPEYARTRLFDGVARLLTVASRIEPLVVIFDDVHWFDPSSLRLLEFLAPRMRGERILLVASARDWESGRTDGVARALAALAREAGETNVRLGALDRDETARLIRQVSGRVPSARVIARVFERTEGNPLFVRETVQALVEAGSLDRADDLEPGGLGVPRSANDVIQQRLDHLPERARDVLAVASVIGRSFSEEDLHRFAGVGAVEVEAALEAGLEVGLLEPDSGGAGRYAFSHALFSEALYAAVPRPRRGQLHRDLAAHIDRAYGRVEGAHLFELAYHAHAGARPDDAEAVVDHLVRAAVHANERSAHETEARLYERAARVLPDGVRGDRQRAELHIDAAMAHFRAGDFALGAECLTPALRIARARREPDLVARAALAYGASGVGVMNPIERDELQIAILEEALDVLEDPDPRIEAELRAGLAMQHYWTGEVDHALELAEAATALIEHVDDGLLRARVLRARYASHVGPTTIRRCPELGEALAEAGDASGSRDVRFLCRSLRLRDFLTFGDFDGARAELARFASAADSLDEPNLAWWYGAGQVSRALLEGRFDDAKQGAEHVFRVGSRLGSAVADGTYAGHMYALAVFGGGLESIAPIFRGLSVRYPDFAVFLTASAYLDAELGENESANALVDVLAADDFAKIRPDFGWWTCLAFLGVAAVRLGRADVTERVYARLLPDADLHVVFGLATTIYYGPVARYLGRMAESLGRTDDAIAHFEVALAGVEATPAAPARAIVLAEIATCLRARNGPGDARRAAGYARRAQTEANALGMKQTAALASESLAGG